MRYIREIVLFFILLAHFSYSGNGDTTKFLNQNLLSSYYNSNQFGNADSLIFIDNSLVNFQNYFSRYHLGNSGMANNKPGQQYFLKTIGFHYNRNNFVDYFFTKENLLFYDTRTPYSDLFYIIGSKKEQDFRLTFSYNVKKNWNITANFFRIRSEGFYLRQSTNDNFLSFSSVYKSKNNRYSLLTGILFNYVQNSENGGIADDSVFENGAALDKQLLDVNLSSAKGSVRNRSVFINQYLNFGKKSNDTSQSRVVIPNSRVLLSSVFEDNSLKYEDGDPLSGFYSNIFYDSLETKDSVYYVKVENDLSWKRLDNNKHRGFADKFGVGVNIKDQFIFIRQREIDTTFNNIIAGLEFYNTYSTNRLWFNLAVNNCFSGYNVNDYHLKGSIKKGLLDSLTYLTININSSSQEPDYIFSNYTSNHFKWENSLEKIIENSIHFNFNMKKHRFTVGGSLKEITNPVYFDNFAMARQYKGTIPVASAYLKKDFSFFNWHLNNSVLYQYVPDSTVVRLPEYTLEHSLFYENDLFKKAMRIQIGASLFFVSNYYASRYMPATAQFYLQDDRKYGNYPFIDFFINAKIKSVRIFFKIDHLNSGWMGNKYMMTADYPMNDRAFKLGISWRFFD